MLSLPHQASAKKIVIVILHRGWLSPSNNIVHDENFSTRLSEEGNYFSCMNKKGISLKFSCQRDNYFPTVENGDLFVLNGAQVDPAELKQIDREVGFALHWREGFPTALKTTHRMVPTIRDANEGPEQDVADTIHQKSHSHWHEKKKTASLASKHYLLNNMYQA